MHEIQPIHASVDARSPRPPSVSSACVPAVSGLNEDRADPVVVTDSTNVAEDTNKTESEAEKNEGSEKLTLQVLKDCIEKFSQKMEEDTCRYVSSLRSALRGCDDSVPSAMPSSPPPATEEKELSASSLADVIDESPAAPV